MSMPEQCPKCGADFDPEEEQIVMCPLCGNEGATSCCMMGGVGTLCTECENGHAND